MLSLSNSLGKISLIYWMTFMYTYCSLHNHQSSSAHIYKYINHFVCTSVVVFWPFDPAQNAIQGDAPEGSDTFQWQLWEEIAGRKLTDEMGRAKKFSWYTHRLLHRKRVTYELHDSYFRLMKIKHVISKIEWALNHYITQWSCRQLEL